MQAFQRICARDAQALISEKQPQIVDIRDQMSFESGHMTNARRVDNHNIGDYIATADKNAPLIVCCYHGNSSQGAAQYFAEQGFTETYSLDGGFEMWKMAFPDLCER